MPYFLLKSEKYFSANLIDNIYLMPIFPNFLFYFRSINVKDKDKQKNKMKGRYEEYLDSK